MNRDRIVFLDTETTGLDPIRGGHRIIEIACIEYIDGQPSGMVLNSLIDPDGKRVTKVALQVHGISNSQLVGKPKFGNLADRLLDFLEGATLVAFNADFDISFIEQEFKRLQCRVSLEHHTKEIICAMQLAKDAMKVSRISLQQACLRYGIDISERIKHGALIDTQLLAQLYLKLKDPSCIPSDRTPQLNPQGKSKLIPIPRAYRDPKTGELVQLNFCKNLECENFGVPAKNPVRLKKRGLENDYKLTRTKINDEPAQVLTCTLCHRTSMLINNRSYVEERNRNLGRLVMPEPSCPNTGLPADKKAGISNGVRYTKTVMTDENGNSIERRVQKPPCSNAGLGIYSHPQLYKKDGVNGKPRSWASLSKGINKRKGNPVAQVKFVEIQPSRRYVCKGCNTKFSVKADAQLKHYRREVNESLFLALVNKGAINRIIEKLDISPKTVYDKIDFIYQQCVMFDKWHRPQLKKSLSDCHPILSSDRQFYLSNWGDNNMPMPTRIINTSTVENQTGFVVAATINFDYISNADWIKTEAKRIKDNDKPPYYRRYSQYIMATDEIETPDEKDAIADVPLQVPSKGLLVHQTYSIAAHFHEVGLLLDGCSKATFYVDRDAGFRSIIPAVFLEKIKSNRINAFQLATQYNNNSDLIDRNTREQIATQYRELKEKHPDDTNAALIARMWKSPTIQPLAAEQTRSEWLINPGRKSRIAAILPLSCGPVDLVSNGTAQAMAEEASLSGVDNWFQILRRRVNMVERPITSATNQRRWNAYAGYNPKWMTKLVEIMRVYNIYCMSNAKELKEVADHNTPPTTPAMRLGVANNLYEVTDILSFSAH